MARNTSDIKGYHAHIYYTPETKEVAARVREGLSQFKAVLGSWHDELVGPHLKPMYQVLFASEEFAKIVPWLMLNREGLDVLVHPETGEGKGDHVDRSLWLGTKLGVNLSAFSGR